MMRKALGVVVASICLCGMAQAEDVSKLSGFYVGGQFGTSLLKAKSGQWVDSEDKDNIVISGIDSKSKAVFGGGVNVGYNFNPQFDIPVRIELAGTLRGKMNANNLNVNRAINGNSINEKADARMSTLMLNTYYDIYTGTAFTPYIQVGIGAAFVKYNSTLYEAGTTPDDSKRSDSTTNFAYSAGLGVNYAFTSNWSADLSARYVYGGKVKADDSAGDSVIERKLQVVDFMVGVRYSF